MNRIAALMILPLGWIALPGPAAETIANESLAVTYDEAGPGFTVAEAATGKCFLTTGKLEGTPVKVRVETARDRVFGKGRRIVITRNDGGENSLELYRHLPFVLLRGTRHNGGKDLLDLTNAVPATFTVDLGKPAAELVTVGTGGLLAPDKNPGSYLFLTCADPADAARRGGRLGHGGSRQRRAVLRRQRWSGRVQGAD